MKRNHLGAALLLISLLCAAWNPTSLRAQDTAPAKPAAVDPEKAALIRQVIDATGAPAAATENIAAAIEKARAESPELPEVFWQRLLGKIDPKEIFELIVPIYDAHYTKAEIQALLEFYRSPAGKKFLVEMPKANAEIDAAFESIATKIGLSLLEELGDQIVLPEEAKETEEAPVPKP
ncbi:MAG TPA: DUF2059 domain-containing protein [Thermoanaerobaculia bacterium]|jgi:hypothetical protein|nr:DUF2059 domain-containing protein [Thermoanaerobaculia bacterium]